MKKAFPALCLFLCCLLLAAAALSGCAKEDEIITINADGTQAAPGSAAPGTPEPSITPAPAITPQPRMDVALSSDAQEGAPSASPREGVTEIKSEGNTAQVGVTNAVAYVFDLDGEKQLYGAVEYKNVGDCTVNIERASFTFTYAGGKQDVSFEPPLAEYDCVAPDATGYLVYYGPWEGGALPEGSVTLSSKLVAKKSAGERLDMAVSDLYLARNYPGFCTLSGTLSLKSAGECEMNMVYVGFYGASGEFLGAWNFTRNALFSQGESKRFSVQMTGLPIEDLETRAATFRAAAYGF
ncbi:MAG: hypothetical protein AAGU74_07895 [Bacillota bacterium]